MATTKKTVKKTNKKPVKDKKRVDLEQDFWGSDYVTTNDLMKVGQILNDLTDIIAVQLDRLARLEDRYGKLEGVCKKLVSSHNNSFGKPKDAPEGCRFVTLKDIGMMIFDFEDENADK